MSTSIYQDINELSYLDYKYKKKPCERIKQTFIENIQINNHYVEEEIR
jgi:hypothetical protein